jgi:hypothetical protein
MGSNETLSVVDSVSFKAKPAWLLHTHTNLHDAVETWRNRIAFNVHNLNKTEDQGWPDEFV